MFNHAYTLAFTVDSPHPTGEDVTGAQLRAAILHTLKHYSDSDLVEAANAPFDSYEYEQKEAT